VEDLVDTEVRVLLADEKDSSKKREIFAKVYQAKESNKVGDKYLYTLQAVHPLYYLSLNKRYEIFQEKNAYEIIQEILKRYKALLQLDFATNIAPHTFIKREYTTQYKQSDLAFIQMLCEQEGVSLWMQSDTTPYKVRLTHINETYTKLPSEIRCAYNQSKTFAPTYTKEDYYDFRRPSFEYLSSTGQSPLSQSLKDNTHTSQLRHDLEVLTHRDRLEAPRDKDLKNDIRQTSLKQYSNTERITGESQSLFVETGTGGELFESRTIKRTEAIFTKTTLKGFFPNALDEYVEDESILQSYEFKVLFEATPKKLPLSLTTISPNPSFQVRSQPSSQAEVKIQSLHLTR